MLTAVRLLRKIQSVSCEITDPDTGKYSVYGEELSRFSLTTVSPFTDVRVSQVSSGRLKLFQAVDWS